MKKNSILKLLLISCLILFTTISTNQVSAQSSGTVGPIWLTQDIPYIMNGYEITIVDVADDESKCGVNVDGHTEWIDKGDFEDFDSVGIEVLDIEVVYSPPLYDQDTCEVIIYPSKSCKYITQEMEFDTSANEATFEFKNTLGHEIEIPWYADAQQNQVHLGNELEETLLTPGDHIILNPQNKMLLYTTSSGVVHVLEIVDITCGSSTKNKTTIRDLTYGTIVAKDTELINDCGPESEIISLGSLGNIELTLLPNLLQYHANANMGGAQPLAKNGAELTFTDNSIIIEKEGTTVEYQLYEDSGSINYNLVCDEPDIEYSCLDTDGGQNYDERGTVTTANGVSKSDYCTDEPWGNFNANLIEYYCDASGNRITQGYDCPYGCENGACLAEQLAVCTDSDGGKDFYQYGITTGPEKYTSTVITVEDSCEFDTLQEYSCEAGKVAPTQYTCPYGCDDGACKYAPGQFQDEPVIGPSNAPVKIVGFMGFSEPYSKLSWPTINLVLEEYEDDVSFEYRNFPLWHVNANEYAMLGECVLNEVGESDFFDFVNLMYDDTPSDMGDAYQLAEAVGANDDEMQECVNSLFFEAEVQNDKDNAASLGVTGSPTFFINNQKIVGSQSFQQFSDIIDDILNNDNIVSYNVVIDDNAPVSDVILAADFIYEYDEFETILNSNIGVNDLNNKVTVVIFRSQTAVIVGTNSPNDQVVLAVEISDYLTDSGFPPILLVSNTIEDNDLTKIFDEVAGSCTDTDGNNPYTKGSVTAYDENTNSYVTVRDSCESDTVNEYICLNGVGTETEFDCPYGCEDGACKYRNTIDIRLFDIDIDELNLANPHSNVKAFKVIPKISLSELSGKRVQFYYKATLRGTHSGTFMDQCEKQITFDGNNFNIPSCTLDGEFDSSGYYDFTVTLDSRHQIDESDESNNIASHSKYIKIELGVPPEPVIVPSICEDGEIKTYTCPNGERIQACICEDGTWDCKENLHEFCDQKQGDCDGCSIEDTCIPIGTRIVEDSTNVPKFCSIHNSLKSQLEENQACQNNYECKSNSCLSGQCTDIKEELEDTNNLLQKLLNWLSYLFG